MKKICICGKEFEGKAKYCSQKCRVKEYYSNFAGAEHP